VGRPAVSNKNALDARGSGDAGEGASRRGEGFTLIFHTRYSLLISAFVAFGVLSFYSPSPDSWYWDYGLWAVNIGFSAVLCCVVLYYALLCYFNMLCCADNSAVCSCCAVNSAVFCCALLCSAVLSTDALSSPHNFYSLPCPLYAFSCLYRRPSPPLMCVILHVVRGMCVILSPLHGTAAP
jgi:hypothetical protein